MQNIGLFFIRQITALASELDYNLTDSEICLYLDKLQNYGLEKFAHACLCFKEDGYTRGVFPSIMEFERKIMAL